MYFYQLYLQKMLDFCTPFEMSINSVILIQLDSYELSFIFTSWLANMSLCQKPFEPLTTLGQINFFLSMSQCNIYCMILQLCESFWHTVTPLKDKNSLPYFLAFIHPSTHSSDIFWEPALHYELCYALGLPKMSKTRVMSTRNS